MRSVAPPGRANAEPEARAADRNAREAEPLAPGIPGYFGTLQRKAGAGAAPAGGSGEGHGGGAGRGGAEGGAAKPADLAATGGGAGPASPTAREVRELAARGVADAIQPLPELARVQAAFGRHDLSRVKAQVGGGAREAATRLGAHAYTLGDRIAFHGAPDLRLVAHEATHVVQQRAGVRLKDGVGRDGDAYERQADAVAERVVAGGSAEDLLDAIRPAGGAGPEGSAAAVQGKCACGGAGCAACREEAVPIEDERAAVQMELAVSATRLFESAAPAPSARPAAEAGGEAGGAAKAGGKGAAAVGAPEQGAQGRAAARGAEGREEAEPAESGQGSTPATPSGAGGATQSEAPAAPAAAEQHASSADQGGGEGGGPNAECYSADIEEPDEEPEAQPEEPPRNEVEEESEADVDEPEGGDECPVAAALDSATAGGEGGEGGGTPAEGAASGGGEEAGGAASTGAAGEGQGAGAGAAGGAAAAGAAGAPGGRGGGRGGARGEGGPGGNAGAGVSAIEGAIGATTAGRDAAVAVYQSARARMTEVGLVARAAAVPVAIGGAEPGQREMLSAAGDFYSTATSRLAAVVAEALSVIPGRLGAMAEGIKGEIAAAIESEKSAVSTRIAGARARARADAAAAAAAVRAAHAQAIAGMQAGAEAALAALDDAHPAALVRVDDAETQGLDDISDAYADSRRNHIDIGVRIGGEARARGAAYVAGYERCKIHRRDSWTAGYLTDRRAEAQQDAARKVAEGYQKSLEEAASKAGRDLVREGRARDRCGLIAIADRARGSLDAQYGRLAGTIGAGLGSAILAADAARDEVLGSIAGSLAETLDALARQETSQRQAANDTGFLQQVAIEQAAHAAAGSALNGLADAIEAVGGLLRQTRTAMGTLADAEPAAAAGRIESLRASLDAGLAALMAQSLTGVARAEVRLVASAAQGHAAMMQLADSHRSQTSQHGDGFATAMSTLAGQAVAGIEMQAAQYAEQTRTMAEQGLSSFDTIAGGVEQGASTMVGNVRSTLGKAETDLEAGLRKSLREIDDPQKGIPKHARVAASKEQPAWKSVVKWVLIIAIVVVVALVIGPAVIGAVGAAAGALGASAAAASVIGTVVGGAIVGAATSATIQVVNNWAAGQALLTGVGRAAIMGAIGGAFGGAAGQLIGRAAQAYQLSGAAQFALNVAADTVLEIGTGLVTGELSWEALGMAVLMSAVTGGFGEVPRVKAVQARVQHGVASRVPGRGAARFAESIRPPAPEATARGAADVEQAGAARRPAAEAGAPAPRGEAAAPAGGRAARGGAEAEAKARTEAGEAAAAPAARPAEAEAAAPRGHAEADAAAGRASGSRATGPETDAPARSKSDAELLDSTARQTRVGRDDHVTSFRRNGDRVECEVCSLGCGRVKDRMKAMEDALPDTPEHAPLRKELADLRDRVAQIETAIEKGSLTHRQVIDASAEIAARFRDIGGRFPEVGRGIDRPRAVAETYDVTDPKLGGKAGHEPVRTDNLGIRTGPRQGAAIGDVDTLSLPKGRDVIYVLRDADSGAILKVGKTVGGPSARRRFGVYRRAGEKLGLKLRIEVTTVPKVRGTKVEVHEKALRARLEGEGHIMPWDNSPEAVGRLREGRLGRPGAGTPYDSLRAALRRSHRWIDGWLVPDGD